jgi:molybdenum cofactor cytidylyltransferase
VVVVAAPFGEEVAEAARALGAEVVVNPAPERGMGSSVGVGFGALAHGTRALLWPVDHPRVTLDSVRALLAVDADVVVPRVGGRGGHPAVVARAVWPALASLATGGVARDVLWDPQWRRLDVPLDDPGLVLDVDTPGDVG